LNIVEYPQASYHHARFSDHIGSRFLHPLEYCQK
jgi:hypothetical protein